MNRKVSTEIQIFVKRKLKISIDESKNKKKCGKLVHSVPFISTYFVYFRKKRYKQYVPKKQYICTCSFQ